MARRYAYGRRAPTRRPFRAALHMFTALDALGPAPAKGRDYLTAVAGRFNSYDNEDIGDCMCVDTANAVIVRTANAGPTAVIPTLPQVIGLYSAVGGYVPGDEATDNGCDETTMGQYLASTGFIGHKATAWGPVDRAKLDHVKWARDLFGSCRLCWNLPGFAEDLFDAGKPWDVQSAGDQSTEGHDTMLADFDAEYLYVVSWYDSATAYPKKLVPVTIPFAAKYLDTAQAELFPDWIAAQGEAPSGFDLQQLVSKLQEAA